MEIFGKPKRKPRPDKKEAPRVINNYLVNKPMMAKSLNIYPAAPQKRDVEEVKQVVNAKVADEKLIHKPVADKGQEFFPVIENATSHGPTKSSGPRGRNSKKKTS